VSAVTLCSTGFTSPWGSACIPRVFTPVEAVSPPYEDAEKTTTGPVSRSGSGSLYHSPSSCASKYLYRLELSYNPTSAHVAATTFDDRLTRAVDTLGDRLSDDIARGLRVVTEELSTGDSTVVVASPAPLQESGADGSLLVDVSAV